MAVIGIGEAPDSPKADFDFEQGKITFTRTIRIETDSYNDGPLKVGTAPGLPSLGASYAFGNEYFRNARLRHYSSPRRLADNSLFWEIDLVYTTPSKKDFGQDSNTQWTNPLAELAEINMSAETVQTPITQIYNISTGAIQPIKNSAGQTFVPAPTREEARLILTITRNEAITAPHPATTLIYQDTCNSDVFWGATAGYWLCKPITTVRQSKNMPDGSDFPYLKCTYTFHAKQPSWDLSLLDEGDYYYPSSSRIKPPKPFQDQNGNPIQGALNGMGNNLAADGTPVYLTVRQYPRLAFAGLNLPQSFQSPNVQ